MLTPLVEGLAFAEGLRWHDDKLWFSDFTTRKVQTVDLAGKLSEVAFVPGQPSGLGFATDGTPLVVSMFNRSLLRLEEDKPRIFADLGHIAVGLCNDMAVNAEGHAWIGSMGYDFYCEAQHPGTRSPLIHVSPSGDVTVAAPNLRGPNGMALINDGKTLVVAETHAFCLTAFDVAADGTLSGRRLFADLGKTPPDGICANSDGDIWVAGLYGGGFFLVRDSGKILETIPTPGRWAVACALGGTDGKRLFCATATVQHPTDLRRGKSKSAIETIDVATAAA